MTLESGSTGETTVAAKIERPPLNQANSVYSLLVDTTTIEKLIPGNPPPPPFFFSLFFYLFLPLSVSLCMLVSFLFLLNCILSLSVYFVISFGSNELLHSSTFKT